jgi:hypothetical protein
MRPAPTSWSATERRLSERNEVPRRDGEGLLIGMSVRSDPDSLDDVTEACDKDDQRDQPRQLKH